MRWRLAETGSRDPDQVAAELFAEDRMARRFRSFEILTLPSLLAQTDPAFRTVILTSSQMPAPHLDRLQALCDRLDGAELLISDAPDVETALAPKLAELHALHPHLVQIRLDDDDALSIHYMARLRQLALRLRLFPTYALSLSKGLVLNNWDDRAVELRKTESAFMSVGTAARMPAGVSIFRHNHGALPQHYPGMIDRRQFSFLYQRWSQNDSSKGPDVTRRHEQRMPVMQLSRVLEREFPFLLDADLSLLQARSQPTD